MVVNIVCMHSPCGVQAAVLLRIFNIQQATSKVLFCWIILIQASKSILLPSLIHISNGLHRGSTRKIHLLNFPLHRIEMGQLLLQVCMFLLLTDVPHYEEVSG